MHVTGFYAALCALIALVLALRVSLQRRTSQVGVGHGGDARLELRMRAFGNFAEYVPLALILLLALELDHTRIWLLHLFGIVLVLARIAHAIGISATGGVSAGRFLGVLGTWAVLLVMALLLIWQHVAAWLIVG
ncbi:MAG TPA: MAPEG family protein [Rhodanobacteraceae bacterium]|nr:MAPEG family protein [Rhodanobacteraceae bacterium]